MRNAGYTAVAIVLHWAIAAAIVANLLLGWWMQDAFEAQETQARAIAAFQLHKSLGLTILVLSLLRLAWRLFHRPPAMPAAMPGWERCAAKATHWVFYGLMVVIPLSGWLYVSTQWRGLAPLNVPTLWFGLFEVPHLFGLNETAREMRQSYAGLALNAHFYLAWGMAALLVLHVGAALKHHFVNRDEVLANMLPLLQAPNMPASLPSRPRRLVLASGSLMIFTAAAALALALLKTPGAAPAAATPVIENLPPDLGNSPAAWSVNPDSEIVFSGVHAGTKFTGRFTRWRAGIQFDAANLADSRITAVIETGSARDGDTLHEETLPQAEWFDVAQHPTATFRSTGIRASGPDHYEVSGTLTIKNRELAVSPLNLTLSGDQLTLDGRTRISRREANMGMESDPDAAYVSAEIEVNVKLNATRLP